MKGYSNLTRFTMIILSSYFFFAGLYYLRDILIPFLFAGLFSLLVLPLYKKIESRFGEVIAVSLSVSLIVVIHIVFLLFLYLQVKLLSKDIPVLKSESIEKFHEFQGYLVKHFNISQDFQSDYLEDNSFKFSNSAEVLAKTLFLNITHSIVIFVIMIIYMFFMLLLRKRIKTFLLMSFSNEKHDAVRFVIAKVKILVLKYIKGLAIATVIVAILNTIGLYALDIKHALFWAILAALLNLIPYVGSIIAMIFPVIMALIYKDSLWYTIGVVLVIQVSHFIYAKFLTPKIIGAHIQINPLATIAVIIIGGALWGLAGMILFLPLLGIIKIICDSVPALQPLGYLIGEEAKTKTSL